jgi:hypothetical protein
MLSEYKQAQNTRFCSHPLTSNKFTQSISDQGPADTLVFLTPQGVSNTPLPDLPKEFARRRLRIAPA